MKRRLAVVFVALAVWVTWDLNHSAPGSLRAFDPHEVGRLETAMWCSYYEHRRVDLFADMVRLLRQQYRMTAWTSVVAGYHAAKAAVVFQRGRNRAEQIQALPDLVSYYRAIRRFSDTPFDVDKAAGLELEWWIIHRQRDQHAPGDLETALALLQAEIYAAPATGFAEHAQARAQAMEVRDASAQRGSTTESDWTRIAQLLDISWTSLKDEVVHGGAQALY